MNMYIHTFFFKSVIIFRYIYHGLTVCYFRGFEKTSESAIDGRAFSDIVSFRVPRGLRRLRCIVRDLSLNIRAQPHDR